MKTEPDVLGIEDLKKKPNQTSPWDGVRNYQARNFMRDQMKQGDLVLIYHSSCEKIGVAGIAQVVRESYPDFTQFDQNSAYFDPKATLENPRWFMVDVKWVKTFKNVIPLSVLKSQKALQNMVLVKKGSRLSVQPVTAQEYDYILKLSY
jgi:predicted RNA-binding protein with PUA-like domain